MSKRISWPRPNMDRVDVEVLEQLKEDADRYRKNPFIEMTFETYRQFNKTGERKGYEKGYFERRKRLTTFGLLAYIFPENADYLSLLENELWQVCQEFTWCLPAHIDLRFEEQSYKEYQDNGKLRYTIDLFAAETAFTLAELLYIFSNKLDHFLVERVKIEVDRRVLQNFINTESFPWEQATHNWAAVCAGAIGSAAIYLLEDDTKLQKVLERVNHTLNYFLKGYNADGACTEGYLYWQYGFGYFVYFLDLLEQLTGKASDFWYQQKVREIALFQQKIFLSKKYVVNFSDAPRIAKPMLGFTHYLNTKISDVHIPSRRIGQKAIIDHCGRWAPAFRELVWFNPNFEGMDWPEGDYQLMDSSMTISRQKYNNRTYAFAAKGGHNDEPHNHNDIGHFILFANGQYFLKDLGSGQYNKAYFGKGRYNFICNSSQGHSVPVINGYIQLEGLNYQAKIRNAIVNEDVNQFSLKMEKAYSDPTLTSFHRTFIWEKQKPRLILNDYLLFNEMPKSLEEVFIMEDMDYQIFDHCVLLCTEEQSLRLSFNNNVERPSIKRKSFMNHYGEKEYFLQFCVAVKHLHLDNQINFSFEWENNI
ncbi:heparinase II/III domain-containing protein [Gracilibacillus xinjiangensis]|uniref:Heparinase II/III family protein n=1 Tax=Gracilibacillus xinjiangensis TaxID=1193282 RepID=A0ABV8WUW2_9BACI